MIAVFAYLKEHNKGYIVLQLHDEILVEMPEKDHLSVSNTIKKIMESVVHWNIILQVNIKIGNAWK